MFCCCPDWSCVTLRLPCRFLFLWPLLWLQLFSACILAVNSAWSFWTSLLSACPSPPWCIFITYYKIKEPGFLHAFTCPVKVFQLFNFFFFILDTLLIPVGKLGFSFEAVVSCAAASEERLGLRCIAQGHHRCLGEEQHFSFTHVDILTLHKTRYNTVSWTVHLPCMNHLYLYLVLHPVFTR